MVWSFGHILTGQSWKVVEFDFWKWVWTLTLYLCNVITVKKLFYGLFYNTGRLPESLPEPEQDFRRCVKPDRIRPLCCSANSFAGCQTWPSLEGECPTILVYFFLCVLFVCLCYDFICSFYFEWTNEMV